jgi:hypothetical protein
LACLELIEATPKNCPDTCRTYTITGLFRCASFASADFLGIVANKVGAVGGGFFPGPAVRSHRIALFHRAKYGPHIGMINPYVTKLLWNERGSWLLLTNVGSIPLGAATVFGVLRRIERNGEAIYVRGLYVYQQRRDS